MEKDRGTDNKSDGNKKKEDTEQKPIFRVVQSGNAVKKEIEGERIPTYYRPSSNKPVRNKRLIPIFLTILSASVVGIVLGLILMQMFVVLEDHPVAENSSAPTVASTSGDQNTLSQLPVLSGYVLQAGVFTERDNAEEWLTTYETNNIPGIIWERDAQYFLLTGIYATEAEAKLKATEYKADGYDIFAKPWSTTEKEINLTDAEGKWVNTFQETWNTSLTGKDVESLVALHASAPETEQFGNLLSQLETEANTGNDQFYLDLMYTYEQLNK